MIRLLTALFFFFSIVQTAMASEIISAVEAQKQAEENATFLVDIRRPEEWKETGVASSAHPISMHDDNFLTNLDKLIDGKKDAPIALICATGGRTAWLATQLEKRGYTNISDVSEGMMGSRKGPGWLERGLPIKTVK